MLQLAVYEAAATFDVVDVAAVIDAPVAQVAVGGQVALRYRRGRDAREERD